jgi:cytochrome d ubiquinol oxidase subunit II
MVDAEVLRTLFMAATVALAVGVYVVLDGFDLGLGILFSLTRDEGERDQMIDSVAPFWDGNETWLVLGGAVLIAMFPLAFAVIMPAVYLPVIVMLLALIFRGVAFEFRFRQSPRRRVWDLAFCGGSLLATFAQGLVLGTFLQGIRVVDGRYAGGPMDWLTPFSVLTGLALVVGYALLGCGWLWWRVGGGLRDKARLWMPWLLAGLLAAIVAVSVWTPLMSPAIAARWFDFPAALAFAPVPLLTLLFAWGALRTVWNGTPSGWPFAFSIGLFFLCYTGMAISIFPMLPPPSVSLFAAAASPESQRFLLPGIAVLVPIILARTWLNYRMFRDRAGVDSADGLA